MWMYLEHNSTLYSGYIGPLANEDPDEIHNILHIYHMGDNLLGQKYIIIKKFYEMYPLYLQFNLHGF